MANMREMISMGISLAVAVLAAVILHFLAAIGAGSAFICVGSGTQAHGGICWALAVQQLPPQSIG